MDERIARKAAAQFDEPVSTLINAGHPFLAHDHASVGLTRRQMYAAVTEGALRRVFRGCLVDARAPDTRKGRVKALDLVRPPDGVACNETAAFLFGVDTYKPSERFELRPSFVVPHGSTRIERPGVRCRQAIIEPADVTAVDDVLVTTPLRTASDLLRRLYRPYALSATDGLAHAGLIDPDELIEYVGARKGYRWIVQARSLAALVDPRAESPGESWQRLRIHDAGFPPPELQFEVVTRDGDVKRLDLAYPHILVGSEYDGTEFHTHEIDRLHDAARRDELTRIFGWRWVIGTRGRIFGADTSFEEELGTLLGMPPNLPRRWGGQH